MSKMMKKIAIIFTLMVMIFPIINVKPANAAEEISEASAAMVFDQKTGQILYSENPDKQVAIGSITKILTLYLVTKAINEGKIKYTDKLTPTKQQADMTQKDELSNVSLKTDQSYTVKDLYDAAWIVSSNSAAMMLAQKVSGNQADFVKEMRKTLNDWGIKDAEINNVSGLNNSALKKGMYLGNKDGENKMTTNDLAIMTKHVLSEYPEITKTTSKQKFAFSNGKDTHTYTSLNLLLKGNRDYQEGYEFDGLKTGTTTQAGDSFVGTLPFKGRRLVTIVMDAKGNSDNLDKRYRSTQTLMRYVNENYVYKDVLNKDQEVKVSASQSYKLNQNVGLWIKNDVNTAALEYGVSKTALGFRTNTDKKILPTNLEYGFLPEKNVAKKVTTKKTSTPHKSWWESFLDFFKNLF